MSLLPGVRTPIRVLLVDDSPLVLTLLGRMLAQSPEIQVVGKAHNGKEALKLIPQLQPAVICTDYHMPIMDGLEFTKAVMAEHPRPILVISSVVGPDNNERVFALLDAGAVDVFPKPSGGWGAGDEAAQQIIAKIKILAGVVVFKRASPKPSTATTEKSAPPVTPVRIVAIGASTGGPQALQEILTQLPPDFPCPVLCVQHISEGFLQGLVEWLAAQCRVRVKIARSGETPLPGTVYFPEEETHLTVDNRGRLLSSHQPAVSGHRPAVDVLFNSVAAHYGNSAVAALLTGMGSDGAIGMQAIAHASGVTMAQDEASCVVFGMPRQAIEAGAARYILPPLQIGQTLIRCVSGQNASGQRESS
ncbi:MAG TPA: chemotaxis-specific protein-glutamate methyltransferase CheB [Abditibacteriaceae bacterium]|jgi:two-component system chemotaxis response regulator CheB